ncbi:MAG: tRNA pseudouridine(38-40) synthase TruA [Candidatus Omnitrophica bacterium]|nr:tRNA pseudouridine(38-40) synthase TruA [Candidatus Omnitrophota bacterium]
MRTLKLTIAYDGTDYAGWQVQHDRRQKAEGRGQRPTIQGTIEGALQRILQESVRVIGSGRTDAGVHALAQVAHVRIASSLSCTRLQRALNALLPPDIVVKRIERASPTFHARFAARTKRYRYCLVNGPIVLPFVRRYVHHVRVPLDLALMRREAEVLRGRHDVRVFHRRGRPVREARRVISDIQVRRRGCELSIDIEANGFLHAMVRSIVGTLIDIGRGHRLPGTMAMIVKTGDRRLVGPTAPPHGLCLLRVKY